MSELIDREATVKQICKMGEMLGVGHNRDVTIAVALFVQDDKSAFPTVEERPHGEWNKDKRERVYMFVRECLNCKNKSAVGNFCMWCGADMRPEEGESN